MKPLLFLDVDGVLNLKGTGAEVPCDQIPASEGFEGALIPLGTAERVSRLTEVYEPVWSTAWLGAAHRPFSGPLRLPEVSWPYLIYAKLKLPAVLRYARQRPWAWVDDEATWELREMNWWPDYERYLEGLIVEPKPKVGLTDEHVDALLEFERHALEL